MGQLINLCGKAIHLEDVITFNMDYRRYMFIPCFREVRGIETTKSFWGKETNNTYTRYEFYKQIPYGVVLGDKESPWPGDSFAYKTTGEIIALDLFKRATKSAGDAIHLASRALKIDTSINQKMRILLDGGQVKECRYDELPAKLICSDGREMDVYKNSPAYDQLGENITPNEKRVPVLEVYVAKNKKYIFFGDGINVDNVEEPYQALLTAYNILHADKKTQKKLAAEKISLPKINLGSIKFQSPFVISKPEEKAEITEEKNEE